MTQAPMFDERRRFLRPASALLAALDATRSGCAQLCLPSLPWDQCAELIALNDKVRARDWPTAADNVRRRLAGALEALLHDIRRTMRQCAEQPVAVIRPSLRSVVDDLSALETEFDEVAFDLRARQLWVVTGPIELDDVPLGRFRIRLCWGRLGESRPYIVEALDPNPAATDSGVTHPHVHDEALCEGDGKAAIRAAMEEGRFFDFFLLVRQILETYNPSSAYVRIQDWVGTTCGDCGSTTDRDEAIPCEHCESDLCGDCGSSCGDCGRINCSECRTVCYGCEADYCRRCLRACDACGESFCQECRTDGLCEPCRENLEEPEDDVEPETEAAAPPDAADVEVYADGVGEVGLPA